MGGKDTVAIITSKFLMPIFFTFLLTFSKNIRFDFSIAGGKDKSCEFVKKCFSPLIGILIL